MIFSIKRKFTVFISLLIIVPMIITTFISMLIVNGRVEDEIRDRCEKSLNESNYMLNQYLSNSRKIAYFVANNTDIVNNLSSRDLQSKLESNKGFWRFFIVEIYSNKKELLARSYIERPGMEKYFSNSDSVFIDRTMQLEQISDFFIENNKLFIRSTIPIVDLGTLLPKGIVVVTSPINNILLESVKDYVKTDVTVHYINNNRVISTIDDKNGGKISNNWNDGVNYNFIRHSILVREDEINSERYMTAYRFLYDNHNNLICVLSTAVNSDSLSENKNEVYMFMFYSSAIALVLALLLAVLVSHNFSKPISSLLAATQSISKGDLDARIDIKRKDEFGLLASGYEYMRDSIRLKINDLQKLNETIELQKKEIEYTKNYLDNIFQSIPSMMITINLKGEVTHWNSAAESFTGVKTSIASTKKIWKVFPFLDFIENRVDEILNKNRTSEFKKNKIITEDKKYYNVSISPLLGENISGAVVRVDEVTELEKKDAQLRQAQKMETVGNLAGGLAHDFNNVLGGVIGTVSLINYQIEQSNNIDIEQLKKYLQIIDNSSNRASDMVQQLLSISSQQELNFTPVDLNLSIKHVKKLCENSFDKSINFKFECYSEEAVVNADPTQMEQVLLNFCINASHAMTIMRSENDTWGGELTLDIKRIYADDSFCISHPDAIKNKEYWNLTIQDTGVGMDAETMEKIFDPFFSTKEKGRGTGLGLSMVYSIIQQHQGFINVYSEPGVGTIFHLYLPVMGGKIEASLEKKEVIPMGKGLILIIEDENTMSETACNILQTCGYNVITANDGLEGIEIYNNRKDEIDLVLLDMVMPKKSGKETFEEIRKINTDAKVLLSSGFKQDERVKQVLSLGVDGFIQKPYTMYILAKAVSDILIQD